MKATVQKDQTLVDHRDSSLKRASENRPGAFKPIAIPAVAALPAAKLRACCEYADY
jgi:hypothetical protein